MKTKKIMVFFAIFLTLSLSIASTAYSAMWIPETYWCHMAKSTYNGKTVYSCVLNVTTSNVTGNWGATYNGTSLPLYAIDLWNDYSEKQIKINVTPLASANVILTTYKAQTQPWEDVYPEKLKAFTMVYDKGGNRFSEGLADDDVTISGFGSRINFAGVIFNPS